MLLLLVFKIYPDHKKEINDITTRYEGNIERKDKAHEEKMEETVRNFQAQINDLISSYETRSESLRSRMDNILDQNFEVTREHINEIKRLSERISAVDNRFVTVERDYLTEKNKIMAEWVRNLTSINDRLESNMAGKK